MENKKFDISISFGKEKAQSIDLPDSLKIDNEGGFDLVFTIGFQLSVEDGDSWVVIREGYATFITKTLFKLKKDQLEYESTTDFQSVKVYKDGVEMEEDQELLLYFFQISLTGIL